MSKLKVAAYCRVSTDMADQLNSLASQRKYFHEYILSHEGYELIEVYYDEGITGTSTKKRDGFNRMINDCEDGKIDLILTKEVSRFARNTVDTLNFTRRLSELNIGVIFMNDGIDTRDKDGELRLTIMASIAQEESHKISERTKWGLRRKMEDGVVIGRGRVYGYELIDGKMTVVKNEADVVKDIFHSFLYDGKGSTKIAQELNAKNIPTLRGRLWGSQTIIRMLRNEKYVGDLTQWKVCCTNYLTGKTEANKGNHPDMPLITIKSHHEPIISREVWNEVQAELERRGRKTREGKRHSNSYWHSGKVFCGACGKPYYLSGGTKLYSRSLVCSNRTKFGKEIKTDSNGDKVGCPNTSINEHVLDACMKQVIECVQSSREEITTSLLEDIRKSQTAAPKKDIEPLKAEIESLEVKKVKAVDLMIESLISKDDLKKQTDFYNAEIERLTKEISDSININSANNKQIKAIEDFIDKVNATENIDTENTDIYGELTEKIIINNDCSVDIFLNCVPFAFHIVYHVEKYTRIGKYDIFIDSCEVAA